MAGDKSLTVLENAFDSLARMAASVDEAPNRLAIKPLLIWSWHAFGFFVCDRLRTKPELLPLWIQDRLSCGHPALIVERDARWGPGELLSPIQMIDLLSAPDLPCVAPGMHSGWELPADACRQLRERIGRIHPLHLDAGQQQDLLLLLALHRRLIELPAPFRYDNSEAYRALPTLLFCLDALAPAGWSAGVSISTERVRAALPLLIPGAGT
ncbi:MAG TPA: hypothetical protein VGB99_02125 [Acidobacteriota bacterium]